MTAPDMVSVIAEVLAEHQWYDATNELDGLRFGCACLIDDEGNETAILTETPSAHQARAVLAAIEQAGGVEWGVRRVGYPAVRQHSGEGSARWTVEECALEGHPEQVVSRITGPWTAVVDRG